jgi:transcriptional regulator with XRE-family HTH domain
VRQLPLDKRLEVARRMMIAAKGDTMLEVSKHVGATPVSVSYWFSGTTNPQLGHLAKFCEHYNVSIDWLVWGD